MNTSPAQTLRAHGVSLYVDPQSGRMRYRAPAGAMTSTLRDLVVEAALQFEERAAIREFDAGVYRATAERLAAADLLGVQAEQGAEEWTQPVAGQLDAHPRQGTLPGAARCTPLTDMLANE